MCTRRFDYESGQWIKSFDCNDCKCQYSDRLHDWEWNDPDGRTGRKCKACGATG